MKATCLQAQTENTRADALRVRPSFVRFDVGLMLETFATVISRPSTVP